MLDMDAKDDTFDATRNLIANYLPSSLNQDDVRSLFQRVGAVKNCKLMRNYETGESLGYAFVEYESAAHAMQAIESINGMSLDGKTIRVSYARKSSPETKDTNVYIAGLPGWVSEEKLREIFSPFGEITSLKVLDNKPGPAVRGIGFVRFAFKSDAERAIEAMAGTKLPEAVTPLTVKFAIPPASKHQNAQALLGSTISAAGSLRYNPMATALTTPVMQQAKEIQASAAVGTSVMPGSGHSSVITGEIHSVYVFGLSPTATDLSLYELFSPFGGVMNVKVMRDASKDDNPCKGFGFVNFRKYEEAYQAVIAMNGFMYDGKVLQVSFKKQKGVAPTGHADTNSPYSSAGGAIRFGLGNYSAGPGVYSVSPNGISSGPGNAPGLMNRAVNASAGPAYPQPPSHAIQGVLGAPSGMNRAQNSTISNQKLIGMASQNTQHQLQSGAGRQPYGYMYGQY